MILSEMQNGIVVIYEIKYMKFVGEGGGNFSQILHIEQITILPVEKNEKKLIIPLY
jgi:hypothetical protein